MYRPKLSWANGSKIDGPNENWISGSTEEETS